MYPKLPLHAEFKVDLIKKEHENQAIYALVKRAL